MFAGDPRKTSRKATSWNIYGYLIKHNNYACGFAITILGCIFNFFSWYIIFSHWQWRNDRNFSSREGAMEWLWLQLFCAEAIFLRRVDLTDIKHMAFFRFSLDPFQK